MKKNYKDYHEHDKTGSSLFRVSLKVKSLKNN